MHPLASLLSNLVILLKGVHPAPVWMVIGSTHGESGRNKPTDVTGGIVILMVSFNESP